MSKLVVVHHAHHPDEEVYRLIFAHQDEVEVHEHVENPTYDPDADPDALDDPSSNQPHITVTRLVPVHHSHQDVVWDARDPKWHDRSPEDIADEQLQILKDHLNKLAAERERAEADDEARQAKIQHFDTHGQEL